MDMILSCTSTQFSVLKQQWAEAKEDTNRPPNVLGRPEKPPEKDDGVVCIIDETGAIQRSIQLWMPTGMLVCDEHILMTAPWSIHRLACDLSHVEQDIHSMRWFNGLHSITRTQRGFLITSTGLDLLVEVDEAGQLLWSWWAVDHGLDLTPLGRQRSINRALDHRGHFYSTTMHTTHINSAVELPGGDILASLFHQGTVISIQRKNGQWIPILEGLKYPHFVRLVDEKSFTVADSAHGRALLVALPEGRSAQIEKEVTLETEWLADCFYDKAHGLWWLLDAYNSHIVLFHEASKRYTHLAFDPDWRFYSLEPLKNPGTPTT